MLERHWTPSEVDEIDVDEWRRLIAFEAVLLHETTGEPIPAALGGMGR